MSNSKYVDDEFDDLTRKTKIEGEDFVETFFDISQIEDEKLRTKNIIGFAWNLIRDYQKDGTLENLPLFLDHLADVARGNTGV